jgi:prophage regulatory protein
MDIEYVSCVQLARRYGVDRSTIWRWTAKGKLPRPIKFSDQCSRWRLDEIEYTESKLALSEPRMRAI